MPPAQDKAAIINQAQRLAAKGQIDKAIQEWERVAELSPSDGNVHNTIGDLHLRKKDQNMAIESFFKAAHIFQNEGFSLKAMALYKKVIYLDPMSLPALIALAELNAERGLIGNANENYLSAAEIYVKQGEFNEAVDIYRKMMYLSPSNLLLHIRIANLYSKLGLHGEAKKVYIDSAIAFQEKGDYMRAENLFNKALENDADDPMAYVGLGKIYIDKGQYADALGVLDRAMAKFPDHAEILIEKANAAFSAGRIDEALEAASKAAEADPANAQAQRLCGEILIDAGRHEEAWERLSGIIQGMVAEERYDESLALLSRMETITSHRTEVMRRQALIYRQLGNLDKSVEILKALGFLLLGEKDNEAALRLFREVQFLAPDDEEIEAKIRELSGDEQMEEQRGFSLPLSGSRSVFREESSYEREEPVSAASGKQDYGLGFNFQELDLWVDEDEQQGGGEKVLEISDTDFGLDDIGLSLPDLAGLKKSDELSESDRYARMPFDEPGADKIDKIHEIPEVLDLDSDSGSIFGDSGRTGADNGEFSGFGDFTSSDEVTQSDTVFGEQTVGGTGEIFKSFDDAGAVFDSTISPEDALHTDEMAHVLKEGRPAFEPSFDNEPSNMESLFSGPATPAPEEHLHDDLSGSGFEEISATYELPSDKTDTKSGSDFDEFMREFAASSGHDEQIKDDQITVERPAGPYSYAGEDTYGEDMAEADFYLQQGLRDEAVEIYRKLARIYPDRNEARDRLADLGVAAEAPEPYLNMPPAAIGSDTDRFFETLSHMPESVKPGDNGMLDADVASIFDAFKRGVKDEVPENDFETHYNLGIAYKEMGLTDDAIREFQIACETSPASFQSISMLALCYSEKGDYEQAVSEYRRLLEMLDDTDERFLPVKYDLAIALENTGEGEEALDLFTEIYYADTFFRDVASRIDSLKLRRA
ncbi:MAG: tetratricopeptide repeat protein [Nitrospirae bacterium]|nr:tetratricopeptide repeat protein [Nitrospirota bacterium]